MEFSHESYIGKLGVSGPTLNIIVFSGVQIQFVEKYPYETYLGYKMFLHFIDGKRIKPKFFDTWEYMKANHYVHGGPDKEDKDFFCSGKFDELQEIDHWVPVYYSYPILKGSKGDKVPSRYDRMIQDHFTFPKDEITERMIQDRARERERHWGEKFKYKITRKSS